MLAVACRLDQQRFFVYLWLTAAWRLYSSLVFGLLSPLGGQSLGCFDEQNAKIGSDDQQSVQFGYVVLYQIVVLLAATLLSLSPRAIAESAHWSSFSGEHRPS